MIQVSRLVEVILTRFVVFGVDITKVEHVTVGCTVCLTRFATAVILHIEIILTARRRQRSNSAPGGFSISSSSNYDDVGRDKLKR